MLENSGVGDSQANGAAERAAQSLGEQARVVKAGVESRLGIRLRRSCVVMSRLIEKCHRLILQMHRGGEQKNPPRAMGQGRR